MLSPHSAAAAADGVHGTGGGGPQFGGALHGGGDSAPHLPGRGRLAAPLRHLVGGGRLPGPGGGGAHVGPRRQQTRGSVAHTKGPAPDADLPRRQLQPDGAPGQQRHPGHDL